ncbi:MAG: hypothetical protein KAT26_06020 [Marinosulfonomonas sp.]|nr:hypothetical protein [Marinosulfonomonas sp.]
MSDDFTGLLRFLALLFQSENSTNGDAAAAAILTAADQTPAAPTSNGPMTETLCQDVLAYAPCPI